MNGGEEEEEKRAQVGAKNRETGQWAGPIRSGESAHVCVAHRSVADISSSTLFIPCSSSYRFPSLSLSLFLLYVR